VRTSWRLLRSFIGCNAAGLFPALLGLTGCRPFSANLRITHRCSARCKTCTHWQEDGREELTTGQWRAVIEDLKARGFEKLTFTGGDIFLRPDCLDLISFAASKGFQVNTTINGLTLTEELARQLASSGINEISVSLDSLDDWHDSTRGARNALSRAVGSIGLLKQHDRDGIKLGLAATIMRSNLAQLAKLTDFAIDNRLALQLNLIHFTHYFTRTGFSRDQYELGPAGRKELSDYLTYAAKAGAEHPFLGLSPLQLEWIGGYFEDYRQPESPCYKPLLKICLEPNGDLRPCCSMEPVGNLLQSDLDRLLRSQAYRGAAKKGLTKECPGCSCHYLMSLDFSLQGRLRNWLLERDLTRPKTFTHPA